MSHPENSTGENPNQPPAESSAATRLATGNIPEVFTQYQREVIAGLLASERKHASRWWTFLSEMRLHGQLPEWVKAQDVGRHADYDRWEADCQATNLDLLGFKGNLHAYGAGLSFVAVSDLGGEA